MKTHVPSMLAKGVEIINKQTQQNKQPQWLIKFIKHSPCTCTGHSIFFFWKSLGIYM